MIDLTVENIRDSFLTTKEASIISLDEVLRDEKGANIIYSIIKGLPKSMNINVVQTVTDDVIESFQITCNTVKGQIILGQFKWDSEMPLEQVFLVNSIDEFIEWLNRQRLKVESIAARCHSNKNIFKKKRA